MKIPQYTSRTSGSTRALVGPSGQGGTPEAFGAGIGRGLGVAAQGVGQLQAFVTQQDTNRRRFADMRKFSAFTTRANDMLTELGRNHDPSTGNFSDIARATYTNLEADFINNEVDPEFKDEFASRTAQIGENIAGRAMAFQIESNDKFFRDGLDSTYNESKVELGQDPTQENFDRQIGKMEEMLASSGLTEAEQQSLSRNYRRGLGAIRYKQEQVQRLAAGDAGAIPAAAALIGTFAGGTEAEQEQLANEGANLAIDSLAGAGGTAEIAQANELWAALPARAQAALTSLASDLGSIPNSVIAAVQSGDLQNIADAVRELGGERRSQEADLVLDPGAQVDDNPRYDDVPYEDRLALLQDAKTQVKAEQTAATAAENAYNSVLINALNTALYDGTAGLTDIETVREMLGAKMKYEDIKQAHDIYDKRNATVDLVQQGQAMRAQQIEFNPTSEDDKKILNAMLGESGVKALQSRDSGYAANSLIPLIRDAQDIPTDAVGTLMGMVRSNDQEDALWALDALAQMQQASPQAYEMRTDAATASAVELWQTRKDFYPADQLLSLINGGLTQADRQQTKMLREEAQGILKDPKLAPTLNVAAVFQTGYFGQNASPSSYPAAASAMQSDFNAIFEDQYSLYGNVQAAANATNKILVKVWGSTQVGANGKVMKFPPEKYYPPVAGNYDWMARQLVNEGIVTEEEGFELLSDAQTEAEVDAFRKGGPAPSYLVVTIKDGLPTVQMQGGPNVDPFGVVVESTPYVPRRQYFDKTPLDQADETAWRAQKAQGNELDLLQREIDAAQQHSLETGIPIPYGASANPEETQAERDAAFAEFMTGDPEKRIGIATGEYRIK